MQLLPPLRRGNLMEALMMPAMRAAVLAIAWACLATGSQSAVAIATALQASQHETATLAFELPTVIRHLAMLKLGPLILPFQQAGLKPVLDVPALQLESIVLSVHWAILNSALNAPALNPVLAAPALNPVLAAPDLKLESMALSVQRAILNPALNVPVPWLASQTPLAHLLVWHWANLKPLLDALPCQLANPEPG
mmetsp:Transcript_40959/g.104367  ORF Transcript_40959/g.104367 Transcript_40959/m.104367 type:complete len:195 (+) Transcript_40959:553-1137(+)